MLASCRAEDCGHEHLQRCARPLEKSANNHQLSFVRTKEELEALCPWVFFQYFFLPLVNFSLLHASCMPPACLLHASSFFFVNLLCTPVLTVHLQLTDYRTIYKTSRQAGNQATRQAFEAASLLALQPWQKRASQKIYSCSFYERRLPGNACSLARWGYLHNWDINNRDGERVAAVGQLGELAIHSLNCSSISNAKPAALCIRVALHLFFSVCPHSNSAIILSLVPRQAM